MKKVASYAVLQNICRLHLHLGKGGIILIELKDIDKTYDDGFQALSEINLAFEEGKINVLIGPSGCGKTTTMKLLNRLIDHTNGQIFIDGEDISQMDTYKLRREMGFVIQNVGLFPHMTIYNNVATVPKLLKWDKKTIQTRVKTLLEMVNLDPNTYMHRYPSELSGGQQQRIGVIRALAAEPSTILMDEPFSALDPISREQLQDELLRLQHEINKTIIFVTHDMDEALKIADQIILMKDGYIVQKDTPQNILNHPEDEFVKTFIGEKRLQANQSLPSLETLISETFVSITDTTSTSEAIDEMITHRVSNIPVVENNEDYVGTVNLYQALADQDKDLHELLDPSSPTITETKETKQVLEELGDIDYAIPVVSEEGKMIGILDQTKLLHTLSGTSENKRGDA